MPRLCSYAPGTSYPHRKAASSGRSVGSPFHWTCGGARQWGAIAVVFVALLASGCTPGGTDAVNSLWNDVQVQFDRVEQFELNFRTAAAAAVGKPEAERLQLAREMLQEKFRLQLELRRTMQRRIRSLASKPMSVRAAYAAYVRDQEKRMAALQQASIPAAVSLGLDKYDKQLAAYAGELAATPPLP